MKYFKTFFYSILFSLIVLSCKNEKTLFKKIDTSESGLAFTNQLKENDTLNILDNEFVYNGAGVALGDLNNDGLDDVFFTGNQVDNKLFINKGGLKFKDVSSVSKIGKTNPLYWSSGVSIVDINLDGKLDVYVCNTLHKSPANRRNLLYINLGNNENNIPIFKEMSKAYGVDNNSHSSHAQFFDYDNDGDLDLFIGVNRIEGINPSQFRPLSDAKMAMSRDILLQNTWDESLGHPVFKDVTLDAGIRYNGFSHSTLINDFNEDGFLDIYVANDYLTSDLVYMNNKNGTFTNKAGEIFKHFSLSSMGSDIADINNDGAFDLFTSEMQPYYNKRKKLFQGPSSYQREVLTRRYDYEYQYTRNTLQINLGYNPESGLPIYADLGMYSGVQETDWSWAPLFADFNNDSWRDLLVVNGFPKDVTDRDFGDFRSTASRLVSKEKLLAAIPAVKSPNFVFKNNSNLTFEDMTTKWGLNFATFSNGAAYGDLDNDGDLDLIFNNINDPSTLMENRASNLSKENNYLRIKLKGDSKNPDAFGAVVEVYVDSIKLKHSLISGRGYLSKPESTLHFGLGTNSSVDSIKIIWPGGKIQKIGNTVVNQVVGIEYNPNMLINDKGIKTKRAPIFKENSNAYNLAYNDCDADFIDFNFQRTLPHKFSQYGPSISVGDVNNDGLDDMLAGASRGFKERWFIQQPNGLFDQNEVVYKTSPGLEEEDAGTLLFDADNDGDLDLYIVRGSAQYKEGHEFYEDVLMINDGKGVFSKSMGIPQIRSNGSCVKAADYDKDGDLDLFIGSRVKPMSYPVADRSYILRNESTANSIKFIDATHEVSSELSNPGMISDAIWTDFNNDMWPDLILAGEWMPIRVFENKKGKLVEITDETGLSDNLGWWTSLASADMDNDGDMDYIAGNYGENLYFNGTKEEPLKLYAKDVDQNGMIDPFISYYLRDSVGVKKEYLYHPWQDVVKQFVGIRKNYNSFGAFGEATTQELFSDGIMDDAMEFTTNWMKSSWIENLGNGKFDIHELPIEAQIAPVYGIQTMDYDNDSLMDIVLIGNDFGIEVQQGRADSFVGLVLKNKGNGDFTSVPLKETHFYVPGDAKSLVSININNEKSLLVASQNNDALKVFERETSEKTIVPLERNEIICKILFKNDAQSIQEYYWGNTFQSQSSRFVTITDNIKEISFYDGLGKETRKMQF
ncbi:hypothetical protein GGR42_000799 [Saonia flava]|uniref:ASPIC/UnbV domain-containing protein n=1 Tax=Saonia flava TaxID=523696 RepID=A0A846QSZ8_9FLAO|nr:VCBS repeat-containing protein [Saonia flava]NJB70337.1 hypothetical protein [Saonia flava]